MSSFIISHRDIFVYCLIACSSVSKTICVAPGLWIDLEGRARTFKRKYRGKRRPQKIYNFFIQPRDRQVETWKIQDI